LDRVVAGAFRFWRQATASGPAQEFTAAAGLLTAERRTAAASGSARL